MKRLSRFILPLLLLLLLLGPAAPQATAADSTRYVVLEGFYNPG